MKKYSTCFLITLSFCITAYSQQNSGVINWTAKKPFEQYGFIENKGQFSQNVINEVQKPILYYTEKGRVKLYFTTSSLVFTYDSLVTDNDYKDNKETDRPNVKLVPYSFNISWEGANANPQVEVHNQLDNYYTFSNPNDKLGRSGIKANAWSQLIYHNLYKGIDVMFYFPDKGGIEYDVIVQPGADLSVFKMKYNGAIVKLSDENITIVSPFATFNVNKPLAINPNVSSAFKVSGNCVSINVGSYDKSQLLIIDPWTTSTAFTGNNNAYDLGFDNAGNVYVSGGGDAGDYQICKYNNAGVMQWTYNAPFSDRIGGYCYYGGLTVDRRTGTAYFSEGADASVTGCQIVKVNTVGSQTGFFNGDPNLMEMWRIGFDYCNNIIVIGGGNPNNKVAQTAVIDTSLTSLSIVNALGATDSYHDMALLALDGLGNAYMATTNPVGGLTTAIFDNVMLKLSLPSLSPVAYIRPDRHSFKEVSSMPYYPNAGSGYYAGNGFNGMAVYKNMLLTYDGGLLRKWRPSNGTYVDSIPVSGTYFNWGGIAINCWGDIYIGNGSTVQAYDSTLVLKSSISLTAAIYDLKLNGAGLLFACGNGFVSVVSIPIANCFDSTCSAIAGIEPVSDFSSITIYPNPNTGKFTFIAKDLTSNVVLKIYDVLGQEVYTRTLNQAQQDYNIDLSNQPKGIYLYKIITEKEVPISIGKVVIQ
jgi:hypothetical protein